MTTPADQPGTPLTVAERQTADELLTRAVCTHPTAVDVSTLADPDRVLLCPLCGEQWREERRP